MSSVVLDSAPINSAFGIPHSPLGSDLPIRQQDTAGRMRLGVPLVRHPQVGPAHAVAARDQPAEGAAVAALAAHGDAADAEAGGGPLGGPDPPPATAPVPGAERLGPPPAAPASLLER